MKNTIPINQIRNFLTDHAESLLDDHWPEIQTCFNEQPDLAISFTHHLSTEGQLTTVKSKISFARKFQFQLEDSFTSDPNQAKLPFQ